MDDDAIARLVDRRAGAQQLEAALAHAAAVDDHTCVQVAATFTLMVETGTKPSLAAIARELKLTPPGVRKALHRLKNYITGICGDT